MNFMFNKCIHFNFYILNMYIHVYIINFHLFVYY